MSDPLSDPPIATDPSSFAPLYVMRNAGGYEVFERIATLVDLEALPVAELSYFEPRGAGGGDLLSLALAGDTLRIVSPPAHWIQTQAPYDSNDFIVSQVGVRVQGSGAKSFIGGLIQLPGYTFTQEDVGRWVTLSDFTASGNNGKFQILSQVGSSARVSGTFIANDTGGSYAFQWLEVEDSFPGLEPRYFPTKATGLAWHLRRGGGFVTLGESGVTARDTTSTLARSIRCTVLAPSNDAAEKLFLVSRQQVAALQRAAAVNNTEFTVLITYTAGP